MNIKKIDSVTMTVKDLKRSAAWYAQTLGLEEIWRQDESKGVGFAVGDNSATLNVFEESGGMRLILQVDRVDDARTELEQKGVKFDGATETVEGIGKFAGLRDPDGKPYLATRLLRRAKRTRQADERSRAARIHHRARRALNGYIHRAARNVASS